MTLPFVMFRVINVSAVVPVIESHQKFIVVLPASINCCTERPVAPCVPFVSVGSTTFDVTVSVLVTMLDTVPATARNH